MKGIYDVMLSWPFHQKVTFTLIDQYNNPAIRYNVASSLDVTFESRPIVDESDELHGILRFVSHANLMGGDYVVDDTLFLYVKIDPPEFK